MTRVTNIDAGQVYTTGLLNMRRFEQRPTETLVIGEMLDRQVRVDGTDITGTVYDVAMEQARNRDWVLSRVALQEPGHGFRRRGQTPVMAWQEVSGVTRQPEPQAANQWRDQLNEMRPRHPAPLPPIHPRPAQ